MTTDLHSDGFGAGWGQTRNWTNNSAYAPVNFNGTGVVDSESPFLLNDTTDNTVIVVTSGTNALFFDNASTNPTPRFFVLDQLTHTNGEFILTDTTGDQIHFFDFSGTNSAYWGKFKSEYDPYGNVTAVTSWTTDGTGKPLEVQRSTPAGQNPPAVESYVYSYEPGTDPNAGLLMNVTLRRGPTPSGPWTNVRQVAYDYYDGTPAKPYGNLGDLRAATIEDGTGNPIDTDYYRYYTPADAGTGYVHGLKYVFSADSYARLRGAVGDPLTNNETDTQVATYADYYFQYNQSQKVTAEKAQGAGSSTVSGGLGTFTFSYSANLNNPPLAVNSWANKTIETLPDGSTNTVYTNGYGEVMLNIAHDASSGLNAETFYKYDTAGRLILHGSPSAVSGYSETYADLLDRNQVGDYGNLSSNSGLIELTDYYTTTTATTITPGGVATTLGGYNVTLTGSGFTGATAVSFGSTAGSSLVVYSDNAIQVSAPAHAAGVVDIHVTTPGGTSAAAAADQFTYTVPTVPVITGVGPVGGTTLGGYTVYLTGTGFTAASGVSFGGTAGSAVVVYSDNSVAVTTPAHAAGVVDLQVTTPGGTSSVTAADQFTYAVPSVPVISGVGPTSGTTQGGYSVYVTGSGFTATTAVSFGGTAASSISVYSDNALVVTAPAHGAGTVDVQITTPGGTSAITAADQFSYVTTGPSSGPPVVTGVGATTGTTLGGNYVYVTGSGFTGATAVTFGGTAGSARFVYSDNFLRIVAPAHAAGVVDAQVTTSSGTSATTAADQFTYVTPPVPVVTGVGPGTSTTLGGYYVYVIGSGFTGASAVSFGGTAGSGAFAYSDNLVRITAPAHTAGLVDVKVTTPGGTSAAAGADQFTFAVPPPPVVTGAGAVSGTTLGGYYVWLVGTGFTGATSVSFGGTAGTVNFLYADNLARLIAPAHAAGVVDVQITTPGGTSATTSADQFTYTVPPVPVVTGVGPRMGSGLGGYYVYVVGTGLTAASTALFGGTAGQANFVYSDNALRVIAPASGLATVYPVATRKVYPVATINVNDPSADTTTYTYTFFPNTNTIQSRTTSLPTVSTAHNGPGTADVETTFLDVYGRPIWTKDPDGYIDYTEYDPGTGAVTKSIADLDTTKTGDFNTATLPAGWSTRNGGGLHLISLYQVDGLGRTSKSTDPNGNITYTVYKDPSHEVLSAGSLPPTTREVGLISLPAMPTPPVR
jgi:hypothetical protein